MNYTTILAAIERADLTGNEYRVARRLLDRCSNQWTVHLSSEEACEVCGVASWPGAKKMLNKLKACGLIRVHTNNYAYIAFLERAELDTQRADSGIPRAGSAQEDLNEPNEPRQTDASRAEMDRSRAILGTPCADLTRDPRIKDQDQDRKDPILDPSYPAFNPEGGPGETAAAPNRAHGAPSRAEQSRSVALLTDPEVGLYPKVANETAGRYHFAEVRAQVFCYLRDHAKGKAYSPGCIPQRLSDPKRFPATVTETDRESALWLRHMDANNPEDTGEAERRRKYCPDESW